MSHIAVADRHEEHRAYGLPKGVVILGLAAGGWIVTILLGIGVWHAVELVAAYL
jgi:hypothetical protein